jgi:hypothetical protein
MPAQRLTERLAEQQRRERQRERHRRNQQRYRARQRTAKALLDRHWDWLRILDVRLRLNKLQYYVEWDKTGEREPYTYTWEPALNVNGAEEWLRNHDPELLAKAVNLLTVSVAQ